jgi:hypothetical protein
MYGFSSFSETKRPEASLFVVFYCLPQLLLLGYVEIFSMTLRMLSSVTSSGFWMVMVKLLSGPTGRAKSVLTQKIGNRLLTWPHTRT